jgi:hypothetical protein
MQNPNALRETKGTERAGRNRNSDILPPLFVYKFLAGAKESSEAPPQFESFVEKMLLRRERSDNRFKTRIGSQRVPKRIETQPAIAQTASR